MRFSLHNAARPHGRPHGLRLWIAGLLLGLFPSPGNAGTLGYDGGLRFSMWDDNYSLGLGLAPGLQWRFSERNHLAFNALYNRYGAKLPGFDDIQEWAFTLGLRREFPLPPDQFLEPRLGFHAGVTRLWGESWHALGALDAEALFPIQPGLKGYALVQPGYVLGEKNGMLFRVGLGVVYSPDAAP